MEFAPNVSISQRLQLLQQISHVEIQRRMADAQFSSAQIEAPQDRIDNLVSLCRPIAVTPINDSVGDVRRRDSINFLSNFRQFEDIVETS